MLFFECFKCDKAQIAGVLNAFKRIPILYMSIGEVIIKVNVVHQAEKIKATGGCQKKGAPHQKRFTWIIVAMNKENVDKSYVFVLS